MEIQSSLMLGGKAPSKMISDRLSNASGTCSGKHSGMHGHPHMGTRWSALLLSPWKQWETVNAFTDTSGSGAGKQSLQIVCCRPFMVNSDQRTRLMDGAERGRLGGSLLSMAFGNTALYSFPGSWDTEERGCIESGCPVSCFHHDIPVALNLRKQISPSECLASPVK